MSDVQLRSFTNGAPGALLNLSTHLYHPDGNLILTDAHRVKIMTLTSTMLSQALRVLGTAYRDLGSNMPERIDSQSVERDMIFVGLSGMYDPPRSEAIEALARCREAGIRVVMITGDHPAIAMAIARELKLDSTIAAVTGVELDKMSVGKLASRVGEI